MRKWFVALCALFFASVVYAQQQSGPPAISGGVTGLGTGVAAALATNVGSSGAFMTNNAANTTTGNFTVAPTASQATMVINTPTGDSAVLEFEINSVLQSYIFTSPTSPIVIQDNVNSAVAAFLNSGGALTLGESGKTVGFASVTTGTNADFACLSSGFVLLLQSSACTISSKRFKIQDGVFSDTVALNDVLSLQPNKFRLKPREKPDADPNRQAEQVGLYAEDVAAVEPLAAIYEDDMKTPKSYRQEAILALLVGSIRAQQAEIVQLQQKLAKVHTLDEPASFTVHAQK